MLAKFVSNINRQHAKQRSRPYLSRQRRSRQNFAFHGAYRDVEVLQSLEHISLSFCWHIQKNKQNKRKKGSEGKGACRPYTTEDLPIGCVMCQYQCNAKQDWENSRRIALDHLHLFLQVTLIKVRGVDSESAKRQQEDTFS